MTTIVMLVLAGAFVLTVFAYLVVESDVGAEGIDRAAAPSSSMVARLASAAERPSRWR